MSVETTSTSDVVIEGPTSNEQPAAETQSAPETKPSDETAKAETDESETSEELEETNEPESDDEGDESEGEDKPKKKNGYKKRIEKLGKRASEAEKEAAYWREQAQKGQSQPEQKAPEQDAVPAQRDPLAPKIEDFETYADFVEASIEFRLEQKEKQRESKAQEVQQKVEFEKAQETFTQRAKEFAEKNTDWNERIAGIAHMPFNQELAKEIHTAENGPEILYHLMGDDDVFEKVNNLSGAALARELGRIEARIESSKAAPKPQVTKTKAPPPINPVSSKSPAVAAKQPGEMDYDEYKAWRQKNGL